MAKISWHFYAAWIVSLTATLGSLFFSDVMGFIPCSLCWYQRIFMYPIAVLLTIGLLKADNRSALYSYYLASIGWLIAFYHNLLMWGLIPESASPCRLGIPCSTRYIEYFGFITIPFLSLAAFSILLALFYKQGRLRE